MRNVIVLLMLLALFAPVYAVERPADPFNPPLTAPPPPLRPLNHITPVIQPVPDLTDQEVLLTRVSVVNLIYTHSCQDTFYQAEIDQLMDEVAEAEEFYFRHSGLKLDLVVEHIVIDRFLSLDQFWLLYEPGGYWLPPWSMNGSNSVEQDLYDLGYEDGDVAGVFVYYAWANDEQVYAALGGGAYGTGAILGSAAFASVPLCWDPETNDWYFLHEFHHQLDSMFDACGYPEYPHADQPGSYSGDYDEGYSFNAWILSDWPEENWLGLNAPWGYYETVADTDEDGLPDAGGEIPLTEASLGSSISLPDTDGDDLYDNEEACAGLFTHALPNDTDTDDDGYLDGEDLYPLDPVEPEIHRGTPQIDGVIEPDEWGEIIHYPGSADLSATLYALWNDDYLYVGLHAEDDMVETPWAEPWWCDALFLRLDASNNGFLAHGQDNYEIWAAPAGIAAFPTLAVSIIMPDGSVNEELVLESDLLGAFTRSATDYTIEIGIPANSQTSLYLFAGLQIGVSAEIVDYDTYPGWPHVPLFTQFIDFTFSPEAGIGPGASQPEDYELSLSVAPQPLNPGGVISYQISHPAEIELTLWNLLGRKVELLAEGRRESGEYHVTFDAGSLTSGIYLARLTAGDRTVTRKMVLLK